jgi:hypothetical protein
MPYLIALTDKNCSLNFRDEDGVTYEGDLKDVALMFAKHIYNNYNGYTHYTINNNFQVVHADNIFSLSWIIKSEKRPDIPEPEWWNEFSKEFDRIMKMKVFW